MLDEIVPPVHGPSLTDQSPVWRYVALRTLFLYLNGHVFIPSIAKLHEKDPFEGEFHEDIVWFNDAFDKRYGNDVTTITDWLLKRCSDSERASISGNVNAEREVMHRYYFDFIRKTRFAWCWFQSSLESAAMWNVYGLHGVAIQSTVGQLRSVLETIGRDFDVNRMTYVTYRGQFSADFNPERPSDHKLLLQSFFLKRKEYSSENEVRFVTIGPESPDWGGIFVTGIPAEKWINAIRLWPELTTDEEQSLKKAIAAFAPKIDCEKSDLLPRPSPAGSMPFYYEALANSEWKSGKDEIPKALKEL